MYLRVHIYIKMKEAFEDGDAFRHDFYIIFQNVDFHYYIPLSITSNRVENYRRYWSHEEREKEKEKKLKGGARKGDWQPGVGIASISDTRIKEEFIHDPGPSQPRANFVLADAPRRPVTHSRNVSFGLVGREIYERQGLGRRAATVSLSDTVGGSPTERK